MITSQFVQSCQSGDENAIQTLVRTHQRAVFQLALSIIDDGEESLPGDATFKGATAEAEAATRQTFITAIDRMGRYREGTNFDTWLLGIAIQVSRRRARSWKLRRGITGLLRSAWRSITRLATRQPPSGPVEPATRQPALAQQELLVEQPASAQTTAIPLDPRMHPGDMELWSSVRRLDEKLRVPIVLRYYHDYTVAEIARLLNISEGTVHARLDSAREKIARQMEKTTGA
jgi:RNA polymerase sigma factor (sigma-70 family)